MPVLIDEDIDSVLLLKIIIKIQWYTNTQLRLITNVLPRDFNIRSILFKLIQLDYILSTNGM